MKTLKIIIFVILLVLLVFVAFFLGVNNNTPMEFNFGFFVWHAKAATIVISAFAAGALLTMLGGLGSLWLLKHGKRKVEKKVKHIEAEMQKIKASPIKS